MNVPIWPGSSSFASGSGDTPFGFYDAQTDFQTDADKVAVFCANRLGYPLVDVELQSGSFYTALVLHPISEQSQGQLIDLAPRHRQALTWQT